MNDEIKEILDRLERIDHKEYSCGFEFADSGSFDEDCRCLLTHFIFADDTIDKTNWRVNTLMRSYVGRGRYGIYSKLNLNPITYNKNTLEELLRKHIDLILQYRNNIETIVEGNEWVVWNKKSKNKQ